MEGRCGWHFGINETGVDTGPNDPIHVTFKDEDFGPIVREAIQNSLDAFEDERIPVKVCFNVEYLYRISYKSFFDSLEKRIKRCLEYYKKDKQAQILLNNMLNYLKQNSVKISCLKVSDYNTKGMSYEKDDNESSFYSFLHSVGKSSKNNVGAGGSYGFGKGAYFALSKLNTVVVSSMDINNNVVFEGLARLTTHKDDDNKIRSANGFYNIEGIEPVENESDIPEEFKRIETGTDFYIIGIGDTTDIDSQIIKSILNNFWLAIYNNKLITEVNGKNIDKNNLDIIISEYFPDEIEKSIRDINRWNPKPYYMAVRHANENEDFIKFENILTNLKEVSLYIYRHNKNLPNRISYSRKPNMVVYKKQNSKMEGFAGVFICENDEGNEMLRKMENPEHNKWDKKFLISEDEKEKSIAKEIENEIEEYINEKLLSLIDTGSSEKPSFYGLAEYLSITEDLIDDDEDLISGGDNLNPHDGNLTGKESERETGIQTTENIAVSIKPKIKSKNDVKDDINALLDENGGFPITAGGSNDQSGGGGLGPHPDGISIKPGSITDDGSPAKLVINVKCKIAAQYESGELVHYLILHSEHDIHNSELELLAGSDNDTDDGVKISFSNKGEIDKNSLKKIQLVSGKNIIKIRFEDNIKHSIKLRAYEVF